MPDPQDPKTAQRSVLDWTEIDKDGHGALLDWYRRLISLRREIPDLADGRLDRVQCAFDERDGWLLLRRGDIAVVVNLARRRQAVPLYGTALEVLLTSAPGFVCGDGTLEIDADSVAIARLAPTDAKERR